MLFRRFLVVTALIAVFAMLALRLVEASGSPRGEFAVGERMQAWQQIDVGTEKR